MSFSWFANFAMSLDNKLGVLNIQTNISNLTDFSNVHEFRSQIIAIGIGSNTLLVDNPSLKTKPEYLMHLENLQHPVRIIFDRRGRIDEDAKIFREDIPVIWITNSQKNIDFEQLYKVNYENLHQVKRQIENCLRDLGIEEGAIMIEGGSKILYHFIKEKIVNRVRIFTSSKSIEIPGVDVEFPSNVKYRLLSLKQINSGIERIYGIED